MTTTERKLRKDGLTIARAALAASDAGTAIARHLRVTRKILQVDTLQIPLNDFDRVFVLSVGKAAASMAGVLETRLGEHLTHGLAVTKHGHSSSLRRMQLIEAGHPIPDEAGLQAAAEVEELLRQLNARDLLLVAVSGGASALLPSPAPPVTLAEKQETTALLLQSGADIVELNQVRKHLSSLKGGRLAALAYPATVIGLLLSDVIGDKIDVIGSGLTAADTSTFSDAISVLDRYALLARVPVAIRRYLSAGSEGGVPETPKPGDLAFQSVYNFVVGSNRLALEAAFQQAKKLGYRSAILSSTLSGETREAATFHAAILREVQQFGSPLRAPACLLSGGETTVTIRGTGKGGRNQEFALSAAIGLDGLKEVVILSLGTDGTDGPTDAAGAWGSGTTLQRAGALGLDAQRHLADNDAYPLFDALGDLVRTGPTGTNVMDIHLLLAG